MQNHFLNRPRTALRSINKFILSLLFFSLFNIIQAQKTSTSDYLITLNDDTLFGKITERKNYPNGSRVVIKVGKKRVSFKTKKVKEFVVQGKKFVGIKKLKHIRPVDTVYSGIVGTPIVEEGEIKMYSFGLTKNHKVFLAKSLRYYADDYARTKPFLEKRNFGLDSVKAFVKEYNEFKRTSTLDTCFATKNLHYKPSISPTIAINVIGIVPIYHYAGIVIGLSDELTLSTKVSVLYARVNHNLEWVPFLENTIKFYPFNTRYSLLQKSTYKYSGPYVSSTFMKSIRNNIVDAFRIELGQKSVAFNNLFMDTNFGIIHQIQNGKTNLWGSIGFGYVF